MARVNSSEIIQEIIQKLRLSPAAEPVPIEVLNKILPVFVANPTSIVTESKEKFVVGGLGAEGFVFTTPATRDFYVTHVIISGQTSAGTYFPLEASINGGLAIIGVFMRTASGRAVENLTYSYTHPIKLDRNTGVELKNVGVLASGDTMQVVVMGYTDDR